MLISHYLVYEYKALCPYGTPPLRGLQFSLPGRVQKIRPFENTLLPLALWCSSFHSRLPPGYSRVILAGKALILGRNNKRLDLMALVRWSGRPGE
jgi:hypothetical protein